MAQPGSALAWGARGRRFESFHTDHINQRVTDQKSVTRFALCFRLPSKGGKKGTRVGTLPKHWPGHQRQRLTIQHTHGRNFRSENPAQWSGWNPIPPTLAVGSFDDTGQPLRGTFAVIRRWRIWQVSVLPRRSGVHQVSAWGTSTNST